jgi:hypothetical protein
LTIELSNVQYAPADCPPGLDSRIGGAFGGSVTKQVTQQCVKVSAHAKNPGKSPLSDVSVFGFVIDEEVHDLCQSSVICGRHENEQSVKFSCTAI